MTVVSLELIFKSKDTKEYTVKNILYALHISIVLADCLCIFIDRNG